MGGLVTLPWGSWGEDGDEVPRVRDWLDRFRPAGAPGAATVAGVPADRRESATAELEPVFAALTDAVRDSELERRRAVAAAEHLTARAEEDGRALLAQARADAQAERSAESVRVRARAATEADSIAQRAAARADSARTGGAARRGELVAEVIARVRADIDELARSATPAGAGGAAEEAP